MAKSNDNATTDEQELEKALAGVGQQAADGLQFEETPTSTLPPSAAPISTLPTLDDTTPVIQPLSADLGGTPDAGVAGEPVVAPLGTAPVVSDDLAPIKNEAINELRPLVDKLDLPPEEKFDTFLLLLRSTDDRTLIAPAHAAAQGITDETKKAQALLDIIKEIDYLSGGQQPAA